MAAAWLTLAGKRPSSTALRGGESGHRWARVLALVTSAVLGLVLAGVTAAPAHATLHSPVPADASGDPTDEFFDNQSVWAYVVSDLAGGRICVVPASHAGGCRTGTVIAASIGTQFILISPKLAAGTYRLVVEVLVDPETNDWAPNDASLNFTVSTCVGCDPAPDKAVVDAYKASARDMAQRMFAICKMSGVLQKLADDAIGMRGLNKDIGVKATVRLTVSTPSFALVVSASESFTFFTVQDPATFNINKGLDILKDVSCGAKQMYEDMAADPPDPNYQTVPVATPLDIGPLSPGTLDATVRSVDRQRAFVEASRQAFERYQGAKAAGDTAAQIAQLRSSGTNADGLADELVATARDLRQWAGDAANDPTLSGTILSSADKDTLADLYARVATTGFTSDEVNQFHALGYTDTDIAAIRTHATLGVDDIPLDTTYPAALRALASQFETEVAAVQDFASEMLIDANRMEASAATTNPVARFTVVNPRTEGQILNFDSTASSDPNGIIVSRDWDFGDGQTFPGGGSIVTHTYTDNGTFKVRLTVHDNEGNTGTAVQDLVIANVAPSLTAAFPARVPPGIPRTFSLQASDPGTADTVSAAVDFGDGTAPVTAPLSSPPARSASLVHTYAAVGTYTAKVTVTDDDGGSDSRTMFVQVAQPAADAGIDQNAPEGQTLVLGGSGTSPEDPGSTFFEWDFGDGTTGAGRTVTHRYLDDGQYVARLRVTDVGGTSATDTATITIANVAPTLSLLAPSAAKPGEQVSLRGFATDPGTKDTQTYHWDFGDGTSATGALVDHAYGAAGTYAVSVRVDDGDGGSDSGTTSIVVSPAPPGDGQLDSRGTDFWVAMMTNLTPSQPQLFIAAETATHGTVEIPGLGFSTPFSVAAGAVTKVVLPDQVAQPATPEILPWGIHVRSEASVSVFGLNPGPVVTDGFLALPRETLGTRYVAVGYPGFSGGELGVLATRNHTTVTLTAPDGRTLVRTLDAGDVWLEYGGRDGGLATSPAGVDFTGFRVTSDHPVAAFSGAICGNVPTSVGACNHLVEQLAPTSQWGTHFLTAPLATRLNGDRIRVVADAADTQVTVNGSVVATLGPGQYHEQVVVGPADIVTSKPAQVAYFAHSWGWDHVTGDPSMMLVVPAEQHRSSYIVSTPGDPFESHYINIVTPSSQRGQVLLDGDPVPLASFEPIADSGWSYAQVQVAAGAHRLAAPQAFGISQYGWGFFDAYSWPGGMQLADLAAPRTLRLTPAAVDAAVGTETCLEAAVTDDHGDPVPSTRVEWTVTGAHASQGQGFADVDGIVRICLTASTAGTDTVNAAAAGLTQSSTITWREPNTPPVADAGTLTTDQDTAADLTLKGHDADNDALSYAVTRSPAHGTLTGTAPALRYTPAPGFRGTDSLAFEVSDGRSTSDPAEVTITVRAVNHAPDARDADVITDEDTPTAFTVAAADPDGDVLAFTVTAQPQHGTLSGSTPALTYTPDPNFNGSDSLSVRACDAGIPGRSAPLCDTALVSLTVRPVNDAPSAAASPSSQQVQYSDLVTPVVVTVADLDTDLASVTVSTKWKKTTDAAYLDSAPLGALALSAAPAANGQRKWTLAGPASVAPGTYSIRFTATDGALAAMTDVQVIVGKESASLQYSGDLLTPTDSSGAGSLHLAATVQEESDGALGVQLAASTLRFDVFSSTDLIMSTPITGCSSAVTAGSPGTGSAACTVTGLAADTYTVRVSLTSAFYVAPEEVAAATVTATTPGSATGGGWVLDSTTGTRSNFGFTLKSTSSKVSGNSLYIYRSTIGERAVVDSTGAYLPAGSYTWIVKSNAMKSYSQQCPTTTTCTATFSGKATIKGVDRATGKAYSLGGGYAFDVTVTDKGEPGTRAPADTYATRITSGSATVHALGTPQAGIALGGGNIQVRQPR